jgi:hypothetical protein
METASLAVMFTLTLFAFGAAAWVCFSFFLAPVSRRSFSGDSLSHIIAH